LNWSAQRFGVLKNAEKWVTHSSKYRGNWSPDVVRNLILHYSKEGDYLLDPMIGGGMTDIECKLLNRNLLALDVNSNAILLTKRALKFESSFEPKIVVNTNDARKLEMLKKGSIDFILTHPPYADIIKYSNKTIPEDLSNIHDLNKFCDEIENIAKELFRMLKNEKFCAVLIGDTRRKKLYRPLAFMTMQRFLNVEFVLKEDIIKYQHNYRFLDKKVA
jgi:DNA modification methylase